MIKDIHPKTPVAYLSNDFSHQELEITFPIDLISALVGMSESFIKKVIDRKNKNLTLKQVLTLLDQDAFNETFVPRSKIPDFLLNYLFQKRNNSKPIDLSEVEHKLFCGNCLDLFHLIPKNSISCVVTSTPYWGTRLYHSHFSRTWGDGEICAFGNEQTPEGFIRHSIEILFYLKTLMKRSGSIWWNLMDTYNTRTQIRSNAAETLRAMQGKDKTGWKDYKCRRYSAGHSYLFDGEQCLIPSRVAERASRIGYYVKSVIAWAKIGSMPEPVESRVTREYEHIIHLSLDRAPYFEKTAFLKTSTAIGGRHPKYEDQKVTDVWHLSTSVGTGGHGAQFPLALPGRCISLSTRPGDIVLDPFVGSGTTTIAAYWLGRRSIGFDISKKYIESAKRKLVSVKEKENLYKKVNDL